jgi:hypothetical protein
LHQSPLQYVVEATSLLQSNHILTRQ